ncbi:MAG: glycosyltransferase [Alphaproteobacteria bacterium]
MKKVCLFNLVPEEKIEGYHIESFDCWSYFSKNRFGNIQDLIRYGLYGFDSVKKLTTVQGIDELYRSKNPSYMKMAYDFVEKFKDFDLIIMYYYNIIHPEIIYKELKKPIKILGLIDDPYSTYTRGIPYFWAFDGAFYISPGYMDNISYKDAISRWGIEKHCFWPLVFQKFSKPDIVDEDFFKDREIALSYVGNQYSPKVDRLVELKKHFKDRLKVHGRWKLKGYGAILRGLLGKPVFPHRVTSLTGAERDYLYRHCKIGINMHLSDAKNETGNARMYEVPAHGMMLMCDKAAADAHNEIFESGKEAVYYDNIPDAIEKIEYYLQHDNERIEIAKNGFNRYWRDYDFNKNLKKLLDWSLNVRK